ncbi:MAG: hypothetical protein ABIQ73_12325 [Acidimicrobiales bacterium]
MAQYLTIPEVTDAEDLISFSTGSGDHSFDIVINAGATAVWLFQASVNGTLIPLVVLASNGPTLALDDVVVSTAMAGGNDAYMMFTLDAKDVRFF